MAAAPARSRLVSSRRSSAASSLWTSPDLLVGLESGDDAAVVRIEGGRAIVMTADFFTAVVDDAYDFGRIAAANALSDVYAMGAEPLVALNLVGWPRDVLPLELLTEVLRGGADVAREAQVPWPAARASTTRSPSTGWRSPAPPIPTGFRNDAAPAGQPLTLTAARRRGAEQPAQGDGPVPGRSSRWSGSTVMPPAPPWPPVSWRRPTSPASACWGTATSWPASGVSLTIEAASVPTSRTPARPYATGSSARTRRNSRLVEPHLDADAATAEDLILLADAQTSGGLLVVGEVPGYPVIGEVTATTGPSVITVR